MSTSRATWRPPGNREPGAPRARDAVGAAASLVGALEAGTPFEALAGIERGEDGIAAVHAVDADVLVDATPTDLVTGEPGASLIRAALERGMHVATAGKGALVRHGAELRALAAARGVRLRYGAATAAALPTMDLLRAGLAGTRIERIEGVLNGTSNAILSAMRERGVAFDEALADARAAGIAEADPRLDVEGWDTAAKLVLLAAAAWDASPTLDDVERTGITAVTRDEVVDAAAGGGRLRLLGIATADGGRLRLRVAPVALPADHPLAAVDGTEKGVSFTTTTLGRITLTGGASSPRGAGAALLRDVIHLVVRP